VSTKARIGRLHVITDTTVQRRFTHEQLAALACAGGADVIQLRDKSLPRDEFTAVARRVRDVCREHRVVFIVNDRVVVAQEAEADGVHLGRGDMSIADARAILGDGAFIGATAGSLEAALEAERDGADYIGFGHIFTTTSKVKGTPPVGLDGLRAVCAAAKIPVVAIGGITRENVGDVLRAGAWGVAVIAAVCAAADPREAAAQLRAAMTIE
jgi:thiamine-phosphate pyrophosphorylase